MPDPTSSDMTALETHDPVAFEAAREFLAAGVPIFIARPRSADPYAYKLPGEWHLTTVDPAVLAAWRPGDGLGAVMGHTLDLVDVDPRSGGDASYAGLALSGAAPLAHAAAATPSGGDHYFVTAMGEGSHDVIRPGLDVKGGKPDGSSRGFAWIAPTVRRSKVTGEPCGYRWTSRPSAELIAENSRGDDSGASLAEIVRDAFAVRRPAGPISPALPSDLFVTAGRSFTPEEALAYVRPHYDRFAGLRDGIDSGYNAKLNALAVMLGHFVPEFMSFEQAGRWLYEAAVANGSVAYQGARTVERTIRSGLEAGQREPYRKSAPEDLTSDYSQLSRAFADPDVIDADGLDAAGRLLAEMLTPAQLDEQPNPKPLINGLLDLDTTSWMIGKSGSYKSFVALHMAACVGRGLDFMGRATTKGTVVYIVAEGARGAKLRARAWRSTYGDMENVRFLPRPVQAGDPAAWAVLVEACRRLDPVLVVVDTQARVTIGLDENDNSQMMRYVERADAIKRATGACVLTVHHIGRSGTDSRGASSIDGAQDAELRIARTGDRRITLHMDKQKDQDDTAQLDMELVIVEGGTDLATGRDLSSLAVVPAGTLPERTAVRDWLDNLTENQAEIVGIVADHLPARGGTKSEVRKLLAERRAKRLAPAMSGSSYFRAWDSITSSGVLTRVAGSQRWVLTSLHVDEDG